MRIAHIQYYSEVSDGLEIGVTKNKIYIQKGGTRMLIGSSRHRANGALYISSGNTHRLSVGRSGHKADGALYVVTRLCQLIL